MMMATHIRQPASNARHQGKNKFSGVQRDIQHVERTATHTEQRAQPFLNFWMKVGNDWVHILSNALAFTLLTSIFPLLLVILAIAGFVLGAISPGAMAQLQTSLAHALPSGIGQTIVSGVLQHLNKSAGLILIVGIVAAFWTSSRLFIAIEYCTGVIFRLRRRDVLHQNLMAVGMTLLYIVLVPLIFAASALGALLLRLIGLPTGSGFGAFIGAVVGLAVGYLAAVIFFGAIYIVVPNRPVKPGEVWRGALVAGALLILYELLFPLYTTFLLKPGNYGSVAGFALVILAFFYYLAFILLLGMEINSWASGQRQTASDISGILHEVQAHNTTRGAAGPTAGSSVEDEQNHEGAPAMSTNARAIDHERDDHKFALKPPKYAEADNQDASAVPPQGKDAPQNVRQRADAAPPAQRPTNSRQSTPTDTRTTSTSAVARPQAEPANARNAKTAARSAPNGWSRPAPTPRPPSPPTRRLNGDVQRVLFAAALVGGSKLVSSFFQRLRHKKEA
jgi:membrane protein